MDRTFTVDEARQMLAELRPEIEKLIELRADMTISVRDHQEGDESVPLADVKAMEARLAEIVDGFTARGIQVKGWAPLLLDFPMRHGGRDVLLCWVEGEPGIDWYHDASLGFAGRRRIEALGQ